MLPPGRSSGLDYFGSDDAARNAAAARARLAAFAEAEAAKRAPLPEVPAPTPLGLPVDTHVRLPSGFTWQLRAAPRPEPYGRFLGLMQSEGPSAAAYASLWAAFDNGWDVTDADGLPIPSPADLQEADYACVLREAPGVVEEIADWTRGRMLMALSHFIGVMEAALDAA